MKIAIQRAKLLDRLAHVEKAAATRDSVSILTGVLFTAKNGRLSLTGSDVTTTVLTELDGYEEHAPGAVVLPARQTLEVLRRLTGEVVEIEVRENFAAHIRCSGDKKQAQIIIVGMDPNEYPAPESGEGVTVTLDGKTFARMVAETIPFVLKNETSPVLQGVCVQIRNGTVAATATDRYRLARCKTSINAAGDIDIEAVIPTKPLEAVAALKPETVEMRFSGAKVHFRAGKYEFSATLHDGRFPDVSKVIPTAFRVTARVNRSDLLHTLELARVMCDERTKVTVFQIADNSLSISARGNAGGGMSEMITADIDGESVRFAANADYMLDAVKCVQSERLKIQAGGPLSPIVIQGENDGASLFLVLPIRDAGV